MTERLSRHDRVRKRQEFEHAYERGIRVHGRYMTLFVARNARDRCRLGVAATRKLGSAVIRNRAKRLARELFRRHKPPTGFDVIIVPRREMLDAPFATLETDYTTTFAKHDRVPAQAGKRPGARSARGV